jgi:hypothetical protein
MTWRGRRLVIATLAGLAAATAPSGILLAQEVGSPRAGFDIARNICAQCHAVRPAELNSPNSRAPSFESIAMISGMTAAALKVALRTSHETMPNLILNETEANDASLIS